MTERLKFSEDPLDVKQNESNTLPCNFWLED